MVSILLSLPQTLYYSYKTIIIIFIIIIIIIIIIIVIIIIVVVVDAAAVYMNWKHDRTGGAVTRFVAEGRRNGVSIPGQSNRYV